MNTIQAQQDISTAYPDFKVDEITYINEGFDNTAFLVNQEYIFRFAKHSLHSGLGGSMDIEIKLLPLLQKRLDIKIPQFDFVGKQNNGLPFVGYKTIEGIPLSPEILNDLSEEKREDVFKAIAHFFQAMHTFPLDSAQDCGVKIQNFRSVYSHDKEDVYTKIFPFLETHEQQYLTNLLDNYLQNEDNFNYKPALLHADLWLSHIFFDKNRKKMNGIIDFGDVVIGDPDYDFMQIHQHYRESLAFFEKLIPGFNKERVKRKALFFQKWNVVQDFIFFQKNKNKDGMDYNLKLIKAFIS